jgi:flavin reductase (DIM6/NTAB) family NADH-FMN oxidoreductase RutF
MNLDPLDLGRRERSALLNGVIGPRPIAWVSSLGVDGRPNLAPFSFFNLVAYDPPTVVVSPGSRRGVPKDTLVNVGAGGEMVISVVSRELAEHANASSAELAPEVDEWEVAGVTPAPSVAVAPPRVAEAPAALECRLRQAVDLGDGNRGGNTLLIATVLRVHIGEEAFVDGVVQPDALDLVGRMGSDHWCLTRERFLLSRPAGDSPDQVREELARRLSQRDG